MLTSHSLYVWVSSTEAMKYQPLLFFWCLHITTHHVQTIYTRVNFEWGQNTMTARFRGIFCLSTQNRCMGLWHSCIVILKYREWWWLNGSHWDLRLSKSPVWSGFMLSLLCMKTWAPQLDPGADCPETHMYALTRGKYGVFRSRWLSLCSLKQPQTLYSHMEPSATIQLYVQGIS